nr:hypothetical protein [Tanacetum cinerariifolium]
LDEQWFNLHKDVLRDALDITSTNDNNTFMAPPSSDIVIEYINTMGYPSTLRNMSAMQCKRKRSNIVSKSYQGYKPKAVKATKPATDPKPKPVPTQASKVVLKKKQKLVQETPDESLPAKRSKGRLVRKIHKPISSLKLVDEPSAEYILVEEPAYNKEEANLQRALELSLKEQAEQTQGLGHSMVMWEPDFGIIPPFLDVQRKGKEKVLNEQAAHDLLTLQTVKKRAIETEFDNVVPKIDTGDQDEGQVGPNPIIQDKGQAGPNPGLQDEGQARSNPGDAVESQPHSSHVVHAGPNLEPIDLEATDASPLQKTKKIDEEFTITAYPNQQEKEPRKTNAEAEVQLMVSVPIDQDTSLVPPMTTSVIDLTSSQSGSPFLTSTATTSAVMTIITIPPPPPQPQQSSIDKTILKRLDKSYEGYEDYKKFHHLHLLQQVHLVLQVLQEHQDLLSYPPPPPPLSTGTSGSAHEQGSKALSLFKSASSVPQSMAWIISNTRYESACLSGTQELSPMNSLIPDNSILDEQVYLFDDEDSRNDHLPTAD